MKIRRATTVQEGHTLAEHALFSTMWNAAKPLGDGSRSIQAGYRKLAGASGLSVGAVKRNLKTLENKYSILLTKSEIRSTSTGRTYLVRTFQQILQRRRDAGLTHISRRGHFANASFEDPNTPQSSSDSREPCPPSADIRSESIANPGTGYGTGDELKATYRSAQDTGPDDAEDSRPVPTEYADPVPAQPTQKKNVGRSDWKKELRSITLKPTTTSNSYKATFLAFREFVPDIDNEAVFKLTHACCEADPKATDDEIAHFLRLRGHQMVRAKNILAPAGFLIRTVPKYFQGDSVHRYREEKRLEQSRRNEPDERWQASVEKAKAIMNDPHASEEDKRCSLALLELDDECVKRRS
jgi:hypothetical protein